VVTLLRLEEDEATEGKLKSNPESVEKKAGETFAKKPAVA
jgi:hypothetical protein